MTAEPRPQLYEASIALLRGKSALHICTDGGDVAGAGRRKALRRAVVGLAIRLLNSGKILYTLNRADRFGAGGEAAAGPSLVDVNVAAREGARPLNKFAVSRREQIRHHCLSRPKPSVAEAQSAAEQVLRSRSACLRRHDPLA